MRKRDQANLDAASLDELVEEITVDANGEDEQLWAFRQAFEDNISVPCEATVIGEPVKVMKFDYDGNNRRGLTAICRRADGTNYVVAASDLVIPVSASGGRYLAAYRKWMGLAPLPRGTRARGRARNSGADANVCGSQPALRINNSSDSRIDTSSSTTNTIAVACDICDNPNSRPNACAPIILYLRQETARRIAQFT